MGRAARRHLSSFNIAAGRSKPRLIRQKPHSQRVTPWNLARHFSGGYGNRTAHRRDLLLRPVGQFRRRASLLRTDRGEHLTVAVISLAQTTPSTIFPGRVFALL